MNKLSDYLSINFNLFGRYKITLPNSFFIRIMLVVVLNIIYYSFQWETLRSLLGYTIAWMFTNLAGLETTFNFPGFKGALKGVTWISRDCLYIIMYVYIIPFMFDTRKPFIKNAAYIILTMILIQIINIFRIYFSVLSFITFKTSWFIAHDIPDTLIWYPITIGIMIYGMFKFDPKSIIIERIKRE